MKHKTNLIFKNVGSYRESYLRKDAIIPKISKVQNRLLKVCYVPATCDSISRLLFLRWPLTVLMMQTRQVVCAFKQSIYLDVYGLYI